ncbi:MAG TPA: hypothetical protein VMT16_15715 [Thermoanaerobaculia bacterium]|nr:hypothetical protein [Thermoanaerobaculia bacterium]
MNDDTHDPFEPGWGERWSLPPEARQTLLAALADGSAAARSEALEMLAYAIDDEIAAAALEIARGDADASLRAEAAIALGPALAAMSEAEDDDEEPEPLSENGFRKVRQALRSLYHDSGAPTEVRRRALEAAVQAPEAWQEGAVRAAFASGDPDWRVTAVFCMGYLPGFEQEILGLLRDQQPEVVFEAVRAVAQAEVREAGDRVLALAQAEDAGVDLRVAAIEALAALEPRGALEALRELSADGHQLVEEAALDALALLGVWEEDEEGESDER